MSENDHKYHKPVDGDIPKIAAIRNAVIDLEKLFDEVCPESRDLDIAKYKLEEARMWAIAAIAKQSPAE